MGPARQLLLSTLFSVSNNSASRVIAGGDPGRSQSARGAGRSQSHAMGAHLRSGVSAVAVTLLGSGMFSLGASEARGAGGKPAKCRISSCWPEA